MNFMNRCLQYTTVDVRPRSIRTGPIMLEGVNNRNVGPGGLMNCRFDLDGAGGRPNVLGNTPSIVCISKPQSMSMQNSILSIFT